MASIDPFVEAPRVRTTVQPTSSSAGMNTIEIDGFRQGVSIRNDRDRYIGALPTLGSGDPNHYTEIVTYGQGREFSEDPTWELVDLFDPVQFLANPQQLIFPVILANATILDPERAGGFIEPLDIPARDLVRTTIEGAHIPRGDLMAGNEDSFRKTDVITQFVRRGKDQATKDLYIDSSDNVGVIGNDIFIPGFFPEEEKPLVPFDETRALNKTVISGTIANAELRNVILVMSGASTDNYVPDKFFSAGTGFTYDNTPLGVDSIAFGGLKK